MAALAGLFLLAALWRDIDLTTTPPSLYLVGIALFALLQGYDHMPRLYWAWWAFGAAALAWTVAPGNTLVAALWALVFLGAFFAGRWRAGLYLVLAWLLYDNLQTTLALNEFGIAVYLSGSVHYVTGALSLVVIPIAFHEATAMRRRFGVVEALVAIAAILFLVAALYGAFISGARAVYVPLLVMLPVLLIRSLLTPGRRLRVLAVVLVAALGFWGLDRVAPAPPRNEAIPTEAADPASPLDQALGTKASGESFRGAVAEYGAISNRLRIWRQSADAGLRHPLGAGPGSYPAVIHTYQRYPMVWSNSAHNVFVETFAERGWIGAALLILMVALPMWRSWRSRQWYLALSAGGLWFTLSVDVTASHAHVMALGFAILGANIRLSGPEPPSGLLAPLAGRWRDAALIVPVLGVAMTAWWFAPCEDAGCVLERRLGYPRAAIAASQKLDGSDKQLFIDRLRELYPESLWVVDLELASAESPERALELSREVAERFPYQHPENFLDWARRAHALGRTEEAITALESGFAIFPPDRFPFAEFRLTPAEYQSEWVEPAQALLAGLQ